MGKTKPPKEGKELKGKVKVISDSVRFIASLAIDWSDDKVEAVLKDGSIVEKVVMSVFPKVKETLTVLNDDNGDNELQIKLVWLSWLHDDVRPILKEYTDELLEDIDSELLEDVLKLIAGVIFDIIGLFTDDVSKDKEQIAQYLKSLALDPERREYIIDKIVPGIMKLAKFDDPLIRLIQEIVRIAWKQIALLDPDTVLQPKPEIRYAALIGEESEIQVQEP